MKGPDRAPRRAVSASRRRNQLGQSMGAKGLRTREKLLAATEALLNTTPLRELTVAQIVRRASTSTATFYVYFNDVSAVVYALIGELTQSPPSLLVLFARSWDSPVVLDRAHEFVASYFERCLQHAAAFRVRNLSSDEGDLRFTELRINAVLPLLNVMAARLVERQRAGDLPADLHPISAAGALLAMIDRISIVQISALSSVTRPRQLDVAAFFTALLFGGGAPDLKGIPAHTFEAELPPEKPTHKPRGDQTRTSETAARINLHGQLIGAKGARTRLRIIEVTEDLLRTQSLLELSVAKIAKAAETSTSTFYLYFQDVPEAVLAVIAEISQSGPELLTLWGGNWEGVVPSARAEAFVTQYITHWQAHRALFRVRNLVAEEGDERFIEARAAAARPLLDAMEARIVQCQAEGRLPPGLHPRSAAGGCLAMIERLAATPNLDNEAGTTIHTVSHAAAYFLSFLMGRLPRGTFGARTEPAS